MKAPILLAAEMERTSYRKGIAFIVLMFFNLLFVIIAIGSIYFFPLTVAFLIGIILYSLLIFTEIKFERPTPTTILILFIYIFLSIAYFIFDKEDWIPYSGSIFYFPLASMTLVLLAAKRPFTMYYSAGKGMSSLHRMTSWLWTAIYFMAGMASILLMPDVAFIYIPFLLVIIGIIFTILFQFFYFGDSNRRKKEFKINKYRFEEISSPHAIDEFYSLASCEVWSAIAQSQQKTVKTQEELRTIMINSDSKYNDYIMRFLAYHDEKPVGTIFCVKDGPEGLPIERDTGISMENLRRIGKVIEVGHFTIDKNHRFKPDIFLGLFKGVIDFAMEQDITFLANCSYSHSSTMYEKIGFIKISSNPIPDTILGVDTCPSILNLARLVVYHEELPIGTVWQLKPILSQYIMERYYKRKLIVSIFKKTKPYDLQVENLFYNLEPDYIKKEVNK